MKLNELEAKLIFKGPSRCFDLQRVHESCYERWSERFPKDSTLLHFVYLRAVLELLVIDQQLLNALILRLNFPTNEFVHELVLILDDPSRELVCDEKYIIFALFALFDKYESVSDGLLNDPFCEEKYIRFSSLQLIGNFCYRGLYGLFIESMSFSTMRKREEPVFLLPKDFTTISLFRFHRRLEVICTLLLVLQVENHISHFRDRLKVQTDLLISSLRNIKRTRVDYDRFLDRFDRAPFTFQTRLTGLRNGLRVAVYQSIAVPLNFKEPKKSQQMFVELCFACLLIIIIYLSELMFL